MVLFSQELGSWNRVSTVPDPRGRDMEKLGNFFRRATESVDIEAYSNIGRLMFGRWCFAILNH
jgi:hypothetical protein